MMVVPVSVSAAVSAATFTFAVFVGAALSRAVLLVCSVGSALVPCESRGPFGGPLLLMSLLLLYFLFARGTWYRFYGTKWPVWICFARKMAPIQLLFRDVNSVSLCSYARIA